MINKLHASKFDECYTPTEAVLPLIKHLPSWVKNVWCPCDKSESEIVKVLEDSGRTVLATHIDTGEDFLSDVGYGATAYAPAADMIITNPPYSNKDAFIERCIKLCRPWALLLPLDALCGKKRYELYKRSGIGVITLADRIDFTGKGKNWFYNAWVCSWPEINGKWIREDIK